MINIDERIFQKVDNNELVLLVHIAKRLGKKHYCFPSNNTLMRDTKWKIDKLRAIKNGLIEKGLLQVEAMEGRSNNYYVKTDLIGVYVGADKLSEPPSEKPRGSIKPIEPSGENQPAAPSEKPIDKYYQVEVLKSNNTSLAMQVIDSVDELRFKYGNTEKDIPLLRSRKRVRVIEQRIKDFKSTWPEASDMLRAIKWMLQYKAREWTGTDMWKFFKIDTLFSDKHFLDYCEECKLHGGDPPMAKAVKKPGDNPSVMSSSDSYHTKPRT